MNTNTIAAHYMTRGVRFSFRGEVATFINWTGAQSARDGRTFAEANVVNGDGETVVWWIPLDRYVSII